MIRVEMPAHLRFLAGIQGEVQLEVPAPFTQRTILDALEARYPMLRGTIRDHVNQKRRPFIRFFALQEDLSFAAPDEPVPAEVASGKEVFWIIGAIAGGTRASGSPSRLPDKNTPAAACPQDTAPPDR